MTMHKGSPGQPVFSALTVAEQPGREAHRTVLCGTLHRTVPLSECRACASYVALDTTAFGGPRVRCRDEQVAGPPEVDGDADAVEVVAVLRRTTTCISPDADLETAAGLLVELDLGGLVVVDAEHRPVGMITETDLIRDRALIRSEGVEVEAPCPVEPGLRVIAPQALRVRDVMTPFTFSVPEWTSVARAAALMAEEGIHRLPVVGQDGRLVGVVTALDVMRSVAERARLLAARSDRSR